MAAFKDMTGVRFGRLVAVEHEDHYRNVRGTGALWICRCDCGGRKTVPGTSLRNGTVKSCGCLGRARARVRTLAARRCLIAALARPAAE